jgi:ParB family chromosome partitioning protein
LLAVRDPIAVADRIVAQGLSVRDVERIAKTEADGAGAKKQTRAEPDADTKALEKALEDALGLVVRIDHRGGAGELRIRYRSLDQLDSLCRRLKTRSR